MILPRGFANNHLLVVPRRCGCARLNLDLALPLYLIRRGELKDLEKSSFYITKTKMPEEVEANGTEVSDAMSENENEYDDMEQPIKDEEVKMTEQTTSPEPGADQPGEVKKKYDPKDPHRPRRKKARRACYACQRAHLTCGESQPYAHVFRFLSWPLCLNHPTAGSQSTRFSVVCVETL